MSTKTITSGTGRLYRRMLQLVTVVALGMALVACQATAPGATNPVAGALPGDPADPGDEAPPAPKPTPTPNLPPVARLTVSPASVLTYDPVGLGASASSDPEGKALTYSWDVNGDGTFGDPAPSGGIARPQNGTYTATVRVSDPSGLTDKASVTWTVQNRPPEVQVVAKIMWQLDNGAYQVAFEARFEDRDGSQARNEWRLSSQSGTEAVTNKYPTVIREYPRASLPVAVTFTAWDDDGASARAGHRTP